MDILKKNYDAIKLLDRFEKDKIFRYTSLDTKSRNIAFIDKYKSNNKIITNVEINKLNYQQVFCDKIKSRYYLPDQTVSYLTQREMDCFYWCAQGKTSEETAILLQMSKRTVENHLVRLKQKLDCANKTTLIRKALLWGLF